MKRHYAEIGSLAFGMETTDLFLFFECIPNGGRCGRAVGMTRCLPKDSFDGEFSKLLSREPPGKGLVLAY